MARQNPRTAPPNASIWEGLSEDIFRAHLVKLEERTNAVPIDPQTFKISSWSQPPQLLTQKYTLPIVVEQQLADDFARVVAVDEGAQSVAAVCIEQHSDGQGMILRFAALDVGKNENIRDMLNWTSGLLADVAVDVESEGLIDPEFNSALLLERVVKLHFSRILARLRSSKWTKPKYLAKSHKKPLWQDFSNLHHRVGHSYSRNEKSLKQSVEHYVLALMEIYRDFEDVGTDEEQKSMIRLINSSHDFLKTDYLKDLIYRLENSVKVTPTPQVASAIKCVRQVQKIAGYRRMSDFLIDTVQNHPSLFKNGIKFEYLKPFASVPTEIGYESWARTCHIHAEVQLIVHYDLAAQHESSQSRKILQPRCIGISKWLCYLCFRFMQAHGTFFPSKTHGRLYDQWTIPDLVEYEKTMLRRYRDILRTMNSVIVKQMEEEPELWRIEPMTSVDVVHEHLGDDGDPCLTR